jgi:Fic family protein
MVDRIAGEKVPGSLASERYEVFVPYPLPPAPPVLMTAELLLLLESANRALGRLDGLAGLFPDPDVFIYFYVRKEALLSSQTRGRKARCQTSLQRKPMRTIPTAAQTLQLSQPAVTAAFSNLVELTIAKEVTGRQRGRIFVYDRYLAELAQGTEPITR